MERNQIDEAALEKTRERLKYMHCEYRYYHNCDEREISSVGMVLAYGKTVVGRTNRTSDATAMNAMRLANISKDRLESLKWMDCAWRVFLRGSAFALDRDKLGMHERRRRSTVSYVLYYKAFLGYTFDRIASMGMPHGGRVSRQRVYDFFEQAVQDVAMEARKEGLV